MEGDDPGVVPSDEANPSSSATPQNGGGDTPKNGLKDDVVHSPKVVDGGGGDVPAVAPKDEEDHSKESLDNSQTTVLPIKGKGNGISEKRVVRKTSRSQEFHLELARKERNRLNNRLGRQEKLLNILMESPDNREQVTSDMNKYDDTFTELVAAYTHHIELIESEEEQNVAKSMLDELDASVFEFKQVIYTWLSSIREPSLPSSDNSRRHRAGSKGSRASTHSSGQSSRSSRRRSPSENSENSVSYKSSRSSAVSNTSKKSLDHKAEAAGLRAEAGVLKRKREAELEAELLEYERKIKRAEAMKKVYEEEERKNTESRTKDEMDEVAEVRTKDRSPRKKRKIRVSKTKEKIEEDEENEEDEVVKARTKDKSPKKKRKFRACRIREKIEKRKEMKGKRDKSKVQEGFDETLLQILQINSAPKVDIDVFSGDVLEFQYFVETFREVVERTISDERGRLTRLIQFTSRQFTSGAKGIDQTLHK